MSFASLARSVSRHRRGVLAAFAASCGIAFAMPVFADGPNVTEVVVRFRDAAPADPATAPTAAQFEALNRSLRTGFAASTPTLDGGFRLTLAPSLPFLAARDAVNRLRMEADVLYVSIGATDAPVAAAQRERKARRGTGSAAARGSSSAIAIPAPPQTRQPIARCRARSSTRSRRSPANRSRTSGRWHGRAPTWFVCSSRCRASRSRRSRRRSRFSPTCCGRNRTTSTRSSSRRTTRCSWISGTTSWRPAKSGVPISRTRGIARSAGPACARPCSIPAHCSTHPDLANRFVGGYDFVDTGQPPVNPNDGDGRDPDASDPGDFVAADECGPGSPLSNQNSTWHGMHVSGTIGAATNNDVGCGRRQLGQPDRAAAGACEMRRLDERHRRCDGVGVRRRRDRRSRRTRIPPE